MGVSPRGLAAAAAVLIVASVCVRLGFWQLGRLEERRVFNAEVAAAWSQPPLDLTPETLQAMERAPARYLHRRVTAIGSFDPEQEVLLRGRSHGGRPGVHVVTPLRTADGGSVILVNRGWLPSPDAATADPRPFRAGGPQRVVGTLQWVPDSGAEAAPLRIAIGDTTVTSLRRLDHTLLSESLGVRLPPLYIQESAESGARGDLPIPVPPPALDAGPHLGYAIQWFSFAVIAIAGFAVVVYRSRRYSDRAGERG
jgi:surfeit locus 1 family protein